MLQTLIDSDDDIDYLRYWRKTFAYKFLRIKNHLKHGNNN